jgi:hypothetical protein
VVTFNLFPAFLKASFICASGIPAISQITVPFLTTATHISGLPFPEPIRTSKGLRVKLNCGKTRIHIFPIVPIAFDKTTRSASSWFSVNQFPSVAIKPYSPKATYLFPLGFPSYLVRCGLRYFTRLGCIIIIHHPS